jgi:hypothetical protein
MLNVQAPPLMADPRRKTRALRPAATPFPSRLPASEQPSDADIADAIRGVQSEIHDLHARVARAASYIPSVVRPTDEQIRAVYEERSVLADLVASSARRFGTGQLHTMATEVALHRGCIERLREAFAHTDTVLQTIRYRITRLRRRRMAADLEAQREDITSLRLQIHVAVEKHRQLKAVMRKFRESDTPDSPNQEIAALRQRFGAAQLKLKRARHEIGALEDAQREALAKYAEAAIIANSPILSPFSSGGSARESQRTIKIVGLGANSQKRRLVPHLARIGDIEDTRDESEHELLVTFRLASAAVAAIAKLNGKEWKGMKLSARWHLPDEAPPSELHSLSDSISAADTGPSGSESHGIFADEVTQAPSTARKAAPLTLTVVADVDVAPTDDFVQFTEFLRAQTQSAIEEPPVELLTGTLHTHDELVEVLGGEFVQRTDFPGPNIGSEAVVTVTLVPEESVRAVAAQGVEMRPRIAAIESEPVLIFDAVDLPLGGRIAVEMARRQSSEMEADSVASQQKIDEGESAGEREIVISDDSYDPIKIDQAEAPSQSIEVLTNKELPPSPLAGDPDLSLLTQVGSEPMMDREVSTDAGANSLACPPTVDGIPMTILASAEEEEEEEEPGVPRDSRASNALTPEKESASIIEASGPAGIASDVGDGGIEGGSSVAQPVAPTGDAPPVDSTFSDVAAAPGEAVVLTELGGELPVVDTSGSGKGRFVEAPNGHFGEAIVSADSDTFIPNATPPNEMHAPEFNITNAASVIADAVESVTEDRHSDAGESVVTEREAETPLVNAADDQSRWAFDPLIQTTADGSIKATVSKDSEVPLEDLPDVHGVDDLSVEQNPSEPEAVNNGTVLSLAPISALNQEQPVPEDQTPTLRIYEERSVMPPDANPVISENPGSVDALPLESFTVLENDRAPVPPHVSENDSILPDSDSRFAPEASDTASCDQLHVTAQGLGLDESPALDCANESNIAARDFTPIVRGDAAVPIAPLALPDEIGAGLERVSLGGEGLTVDGVKSPTPEDIKGGVRDTDSKSDSERAMLPRESPTPPEPNAIPDNSAAEAMPLRFASTDSDEGARSRPTSETAAPAIGDFAGDQSDQEVKRPAARPPGVDVLSVTSGESADDSDEKPASRPPHPAASSAVEWLESDSASDH